MRRIVPACLALGLGLGFAEGAFVGGGVSIYVFIPTVSVHAGFELAENLSLRGSLDSIVLANVLSVDVLYAFPDASPTVYAGGGPDGVVLFEGPPGERMFFGVHGTIGVEFRQDSLGYYLEAQPGLAFVSYVQPFLRMRAGLNFHF